MAGSTTDLKFAALRAQGFTGAMSDMMLQWLRFNGAQDDTNSIPDAWREMLNFQGYPEGDIAPGEPWSHRNDGWHELLSDLGYVGSLSDMENMFWAAGGLIQFSYYYATDANHPVIDFIDINPWLPGGLPFSIYFLAVSEAWEPALLLMWNSYAPDEGFYTSGSNKIALAFRDTDGIKHALEVTDSSVYRQVRADFTIDGVTLTVNDKSPVSVTGVTPRNASVPATSGMLFDSINFYPGTLANVFFTDYSPMQDPNRFYWTADNAAYVELNNPITFGAGDIRIAFDWQRTDSVLGAENIIFGEAGNAPNRFRITDTGFFALILDGTDDVTFLGLIDDVTLGRNAHYEVERYDGGDAWRARVDGGPWVAGTNTTPQSYEWQWDLLLSSTNPSTRANGLIANIEVSNAGNTWIYTLDKFPTNAAIVENTGNTGPDFNGAWDTGGGNYSQISPRSRLYRMQEGSSNIHSDYYGNGSYNWLRTGTDDALNGWNIFGDAWPPDL